MNPTTFWPVTLVDYAQVLSAVATAAAVITSLWLALRKPTPLVQVSATLRMLIGTALPEPKDSRYLTIAVINTGEVDASITAVGWRLKRWFLHDIHAVQDVSITQPLPVRNAALPVRLAHGEEAQYFIPLQGRQNWADHIRRDGFLPELVKSRSDLKRLRVVAHTSVGKVALAKPARSVLDLIWQLQQEYRSGRSMDGGESTAA